MYTSMKDAKDSPFLRNLITRRNTLQTTAMIGIGSIFATMPTKAQESPPSPENYDDILDSMNGSGSEEDPYVITNVVELQAMDGDRDAHYVLGNDIDASSTDEWNDIEELEGIEIGPVSSLNTGEENTTNLPFGPIVEGSETIETEDFGEREIVDPDEYTIDYETGEITFNEEPARAAADLIASYELVEPIATGFEPIGQSNVEKFTGSLNGGGFVINDIYIQRPHQNDIGIFRSFDDDGTLENISFNNIQIEGGTRNTGGIIGNARTMTADSVTVEGTIIGQRDVGGFAGRGREPYLTNLDLDVTVTGGRDVGGCIGATPTFDDTTEIRNSTINATVSSEQERVSSQGVVGGVVGRVNDTLCDNLTVDATVTGGSDTSGTGGGFGRFDSSQCTNSVFTGEVSINGSSEDTGGIAGRALDTDIIECLTDVVVSGNQFVGGVVGSTRDDTHIIQTHAEGDVDGSQGVGGFVGRHRDSTIRRCSADNDVTSDSDVGGFVGNTDDGTDDDLSSLINLCFSSGTVTNRQGETSRGTLARNNVTGGFVGTNMGDGSVIKYAYSTDTVVSEAEDGSSFRENGVGGFVGNNFATIKSSYRAGETTGNDNVGGFVGNPAPDEDAISLIENVYWDTESTEQDERSGVSEDETEGTPDFAGEVEGLTTDEMQGKTAAENMGALDFSDVGDEVWFTVSEGDNFNPTATRDGYPILQTVDPEPQLEAQGIAGDTDPSPADFDVEIVSPNDGEEVTEDQSLDVDVDVANTGDQQAEKIVEIIDPIQEVTEVDLVGGDTDTVSFIIPDGEVDGEFTITVKSPDDTDQVTVTAVDPCFIATAAYDTPTAGEIDILRDFRDDVLRQHVLGRLFIKTYYKSSPPIAQWIRRNRTRRELVKQYFVEPLVDIVQARSSIWKRE